jgi:hypothetical protein
MQIARAKNRAELKHHLLPRNKAFLSIVQAAHRQSWSTALINSRDEIFVSVSAIYDVTAAFQHPKQPKLVDLLFGRSCQAELFIRRIPMSIVPHDDEEKLIDFLHQTFEEKVC